IRMLEEYSGPIVREFAQNRAMTYQSVCHRDAKLRFAALSLVNMKWGVTQDIANLSEELALNDPDARVRGSAILCLSGFYVKTQSPRVIRLFATIVRNEKEELDVREVAYSALWRMREHDPLKWQSPIFKFPDDVDWEFVDSCLQSSN